MRLFLKAHYRSYAVLLRFTRIAVRYASGNFVKPRNYDGIITGF